MPSDLPLKGQQETKGTKEVLRAVFFHAGPLRGKSPPIKFEICPPDKFNFSKSIRSPPEKKKTKKKTMQFLHFSPPARGLISTSRFPQFPQGRLSTLVSAGRGLSILLFE